MAWRSKEHKNEYYRRLRREDPELVRERDRAYQAKNRVRLQVYKRAWYLANKERTLSVNQAYREANPEKIQQLHKEWGMIQKGEIGARKRLDKWLSRAGWGYGEYQRRLANGCEICGRKGLELVFDHDHDTGLVRGLLCRRCNIKLDWALEHYEIIGCYQRFSLEAVA